MKRVSQRQARGFTLIEVLMAMAIFTMVIGAIYATWTIILKSSKISLAAAAQVQRERIAVHTIEQALMSARSFQVDLDHYGFVVDSGDAATVSFVARLPKSFPRSGKFGDFDVRRVTFAIENGQNYSEHDLVMRQNPILMDLDDDEKEHPLVLAKGVKDLMFEFWDGRKNDWSDTWTQSNTLPKIVKFSLTFGQPNQQFSTSQNKDVVTRIVALPAITVPPSWQGGGGQGLGRPPTPGQPGISQPPIPKPGQPGGIRP